MDFFRFPRAGWLTAWGRAARWPWGLCGGRHSRPSRRGFLAGIAHAFLIIWSVRFLMGMGESVIFPSSNRWVANWIPTTERGLANGLIFAGVGAGSAFAPPLFRYAMVHLGWRVVFLGVRRTGIAGGRGVVLGWRATILTTTPG